jgi:hypothetical protein
LLMCKAAAWARYWTIMTCSRLSIAASRPVGMLGILPP